MRVRNIRRDSFDEPAEVVDAEVTGLSCPLRRNQMHVEEPARTANRQLQGTAGNDDI